MFKLGCSVIFYGHPRLKFQLFRSFFAAPREFGAGRGTLP
jgi:hypothetical protein